MTTISPRACCCGLCLFLDFLRQRRSILFLSLRGGETVFLAVVSVLGGSAQVPTSTWSDRITL